MTVCPDCGYHEPVSRSGEERPWWNPHAEYAELVLEIDALFHPCHRQKREART